MNIRVALTLATICFGCSTAMSQQTFSWTNFSGGDFNNPTNWNPVGGPGIGGSAKFDLPGYRYLVLSNETDLAQMTVGRSDLGFAPYDDADFDLGFLQILGGELPNGTIDFLRPGRLRLLGDGISLADDVVVGNGMRPSQLVIGQTHPLYTDRYVQTNAASLSFKLGPNSPDDPFKPRLKVELLNEFGGSVNIRPSNNGYPAIGTVVDLIETSSGFATGDLQLLSFPVRAGRSLNLEFATDPIRLLASVTNVDEVASLELLGDETLTENPTGLAVGDLNDDDVPDLVMLQPSGKILVFEGDGTGLFLTPAQYGIGVGPVDVAIGDFDRDGTNDVAVISTENNQLEILLNPFADPNDLVTGPVANLEGEPISIAAIVYPAAVGFTESTGVAVTTKGGSGRGQTTSYKTNSSGTEKSGDVDVGDDPGPSDPIDDEGKKDDSTDAVGVGGTAAALAGDVPVLQLLGVIPDGLGGIELLRSIPLSGRALDLASGDVDGDGILDTFILTTNGQLNHVTSLVPGSVARSIPLEGEATAIAIADLDLDGIDEIMIAENDPSTISIFRPVTSLSARGNFEPGMILERIARIPADQPSLTLAATSANTSGLPGRVLTGLRAVGTESPELTVEAFDTTPVPTCVFADFNGDDVVNGTDIGAMIGVWGPCEGCAPDLNGDDVVDAADLGLLFVSWGPCDS